MADRGLLAHASTSDPMRLSTLQRIFVEHRGNISDKWEHYLAVYDWALSRFVDRGKPVRLLEVGVQNGGSLQVWSKYLPRNSTIVGIDVDPACGGLSLGPNITVLVGDASDPVALQHMLGDARFDVIIDDGSHRSEHVIATFQACFNRLDPGGVYVVEDMHASYFASHGGGFRRAGTSMEWFKGLLDALNSDHFENDAFKQLDKPSIQLLQEFGYQIACISFFDSVVLIKKLASEKRVPYRRIITGHEAPVVDIASQALSTLTDTELRGLLLPPSTAAAFHPGALDAVASAREEVGKLRTLLAQTEAQAGIWEAEARENERTQRELEQLRTLLTRTEADASKWEARAKENERAQRELAEVRARLARAESQAKENERAREQVVQRIRALRRDFYDANNRREQAEETVARMQAQVVQAQATVAQAVAQAETATAQARAATVQADHAEAWLNAILSSTAWQITWPIRVAGSKLPPMLRGLVRRSLKFSWWCATLQLSQKLKERRAMVALTPALAPRAIPSPVPAPIPAAPDSTLERQAVRYRIDRNAGLAADDDVLIYVAYCSDGLLTELQKRCIEAYHSEGYRVVLVVNAGTYSCTISPGQTPAAIVIVRENVGFDFGAWADVARLIEGLETVRSVTFANDSVVGPLPLDGTTGLRARVDTIDADTVFMTRCLEIQDHLQSYFFTFKRGALAKRALSVILDVTPETDKVHLIQTQEVSFSSRLEALGISTREAFPCTDADTKLQNPTIHNWRTLIGAGFPFVKVSLVTHGIVDIESAELAAVLGHDLIEALRTHISKRLQPALGKTAESSEEGGE